MARGGGLEPAIENMTAIHYVNAPNHAHAVLRQLRGVLDSLYDKASDDPLLFAYQLQQEMPIAAKFVIDISKWASAVVDTTPDQIPNNGARLCR